MRSPLHLKISFLRLLSAIVITLSVTHAATAQDQSVARQWNEILLQSIRLDFARPTLHARNLCHISVAMWNGWATYDAQSNPWIFNEHHTAVDIEAARRETISFAAYRMLLNRFATSPGFATMSPQYRSLMAQLGYDTTNTSIVGDSPAAIGNRIAQALITFGLADHSNQINSYANQYYQPINPSLVVNLLGNPTVVDVRRYQPLSLTYFVDQSGQVVPGGFPPFLSAEWGNVTPFAMTSADRTDYVRDNKTWPVYNDPGAPPTLGGIGDNLWRRGHEMVAVWSSHLDPSDGVTWDISPKSMGNITAPTDWNYESYYKYNEGGDAGTGYTVNPITGQPYAPNLVKRGDYARVLAEFWADGPTSETPPGHWFTILNYVRDHPLSNRRMGGVGAELDPLEYDVKAYLALGGAMHDTAISVWGTKGWYDTSRPISAIRWMCGKGQCSDPSGANFHTDGIHLIPNEIELITAETTAPGQRHEQLEGNEGSIAIKAWRGPYSINNPQTDVAGVGWILGKQWWPYQRPTFVTPPFAGYTSGHSSFSRSAAHVLELLTGSKYFPGGLGTFTATQNQYLVFEDGPSTNVTLQFASYYDAADQSALSRIWGGIHPPFDDIPSRVIGDKTGPEAFQFAKGLWGITLCLCDINNDHVVDGMDFGILLGQWGSAGTADFDQSGIVDGFDLGTLMGAWGSCN